jgi:hypothetical protein
MLNDENIIYEALEHDVSETDPETETSSIYWALTCWARSRDVMCFLWGMDKPIVLSWALNKRRGDG